MLGAFIRSETPLTVRDLMEIYTRLSRPRINAELSEMFNDGHIEPSPDTTAWAITAKGKTAWQCDDDDE
jgi:hypothetical protein